MDISKLSKDQMEVIMNKLLSQKTIDKEFIVGTLMASPTSEMKRCTDAMHALLCKSKHEEDCSYYSEEELNDCWIKASHMHWLKKTIDFMKENEVDDETMLKSVISMARNSAEDILRKHPSVRALLLLILKRL